MSYCYYPMNIGLDIVFFCTKRAALNYAKAHNLPKLSNGHWGIGRANDKIAAEVRKDFNERKLELEANKEVCHVNSISG